jgi:hypothetical protein
MAASFVSGLLRFACRTRHRDVKLTFLKHTAYVDPDVKFVLTGGAERELGFVLADAFFGHGQCRLHAGGIVDFDGCARPDSLEPGPARP